MASEHYLQFQLYGKDSDRRTFYLYSLGMAWAAVFLTNGDMSLTLSLIANIMIGTIMLTRMLDNTRRADARINWLGSCEKKTENQGRNNNVFITTLRKCTE